MSVYRNRLLSFSGSHFEIGRQVGEQYRKWGKKELYIPIHAKQLLSTQIKLYENYYPNYIDYLRGVAKGCLLDEQGALLSFLTGFLHPPKATINRCSSLVIRNHQGIYIGRNYDYFESSEKASALINYRHTNDSAFSFIGITDMAASRPYIRMPSGDYVIMIDDAWNDKGLYISLNGAPGNSAYTGICITHSVQLIAESCSSVDEAINAVEKTPLNRPVIFTLADKKGNMAVVEKPLSEKMRIRRSEKFVVATNHYIDSELSQENLSIFKDLPFHSTFARYSFLDLSIRAKMEQFDILGILNMLNKPPVMQEWRGTLGDSLTIWSYALELKTGKYRITFAPLLKEKLTISS